MKYRSKNMTRPSYDQIRNMAQTMDIDEIADNVGLPATEIAQIVGNRSAKWLLSDLKTGRWWHCYSERACYRKAQMIGLTDYDFGRA